jgi:hypothetical protein
LSIGSNTTALKKAKEILEGRGLRGNSIFKYLQDMKYPEITLYFVEDEKLILIW